MGTKPVWCCQEPCHKSKCIDDRDPLPELCFTVTENSFSPNPGNPDLVGVFRCCLEEGGFGTLSESFRKLNILCMLVCN